MRVMVSAVSTIALDVVAVFVAGLVGASASGCGGALTCPHGQLPDSKGGACVCPAGAFLNTQSNTCECMNSDRYIIDGECLSLSEANLFCGNSRAKKAECKNVPCPFGHELAPETGECKPLYEWKSEQEEEPESDIQCKEDEVWDGTKCAPPSCPYYFVYDSEKKLCVVDLKALLYREFGYDNGPGTQPFCTELSELAADFGLAPGKSEKMWFRVTLAPQSDMFQDVKVDAHRVDPFVTDSNGAYLLLHGGCDPVRWIATETLDRLKLEFYDQSLQCNVCRQRTLVYCTITNTNTARKPSNNPKPAPSKHPSDHKPPPSGGI